MNAASTTVRSDVGSSPFHPFEPPGSSRYPGLFADAEQRHIQPSPVGGKVTGQFAVQIAWAGHPEEIGWLCLVQNAFELLPRQSRPPMPIRRTITLVDDRRFDNSLACGSVFPYPCQVVRLGVQFAKNNLGPRERRVVAVLRESAWRYAAIERASQISRAPFSALVVKTTSRSSGETSYCHTERSGNGRSVFL